MKKETGRPAKEPKLIDTPATATPAGDVILVDHPQGVALSFTPKAAAQTGRNLSEAARHVSDGDLNDDATAETAPDPSPRPQST